MGNFPTDVCADVPFFGVSNQYNPSVNGASFRNKSGLTFEKFPKFSDNYLIISTELWTK